MNPLAGCIWRGKEGKIRCTDWIQSSPHLSCTDAIQSGEQLGGGGGGEKEHRRQGGLSMSCWNQRPSCSLRWLISRNEAKQHYSVKRAHHSSVCLRSLKAFKPQEVDNGDRRQTFIPEQGQKVGLFFPVYLSVCLHFQPIYSFPG